MSTGNMEGGDGAPNSSEHENSNLVRLGHTDLYVSRFCQGTAFRTSPRRADNEMGQRALRRALDLGVNFFNSAMAYGWGGSEEALGKAIAGRRDQVIISTKIPPTHMPEEEEGETQRARFTRDFMFRMVEGSLKRLGTDYIDLYLFHSPDKVTPQEELVDSMDALVKAGKIRYWGASRYTPSQVGKFSELAKTRGKARIAAIEEYYNIAGGQVNDQRKAFTREIERGMFPVLRRENIGILAFSPMDRGALVPGREADLHAPLLDLIAVIDTVASELGVSRAEVCFAWTMTHPEVTSVLGGPERPEHVDQAVSGANMVLPGEAVTTLNAASIAFSTALESGQPYP